MNDRQTLERIATLVAEHTRAAAIDGPVDPALIEIRQVLDERAAEIERKQETRADWAAEVQDAANVAVATGTNLGRKLGLILDLAASFVRHGSDLGGGLMPYRFKSLAEAVKEQATEDAARRDAVINAAAVVSEAGNDLFRYGAATAARYCWKAEDGLRAAFGLKSPDAAPAPAPEKKE